MMTFHTLNALEKKQTAATVTVKSFHALKMGPPPLR